MNSNQISIAVDDLIALTLEGKWELAFNKYYHQNFEKTDLDGVTVKGMEQNTLNGRAFSSKISNVRDFSCVGRLVKGNRSFLVWSFDFDVAGSPFKVVEVAIQDWDEGKIVTERFYS
ncbi:MAG: hypothetical protein KF763_16420 [Cyclobacteriaceae bacterium]|nr:hypothetical protein [Cyclobacteriaceae bacterium]